MTWPVFTLALDSVKISSPTLIKPMPMAMRFFLKSIGKQITVAGFMNMFIAWETFLESSLVELMTGAPHNQRKRADTIYTTTYNGSCT